MKYMKILKASVILVALQITGITGYSQSGGTQPWPVETLPAVETPLFKADTFNIVRYGAISDGVTLNTKSINDAIAACSQNGGGVVVVPAGLWLTGPVELKSNVNLHLKNNAVLSFTKDFNQYKLVETSWEGLAAVRNQPPVSGTDLENIAITGTGIIDGNGDAWRMVKKEKLTESQWKKLIASGGALSADKKTWYPSEKSLKGSLTQKPGVITEGKTVKDYEDIKDFLRPNLLVLTRCRKVLLEGVTFQNSPAWNLHPLMCENLTLRNINVKNPWYAQNGDGVDVESCKNVLIEHSVFDVGDDGICIKSGRDEQGRKRGMPTENILVRNCVVYHAHGGFVVGSEMSGGARNLFVADCTFIGTDIGLRFKTTRGRGGLVEKVYIRNISMKDIAGDAVLFDMYYEAKDPVPLTGEQREAPKVVQLPVTEATPQFRDFYVSNVICDGAERAVFVRGLPEMNINSIWLENMTLKAKNGIEIEEADKIQFKDIRLVTADSNPVISILNSSALTFDKIAFNQRAGLLFSVNGSKSAGITVLNTNTGDSKSQAEFNQGATKKALKIK